MAGFSSSSRLEQRSMASTTLVSPGDSSGGAVDAALWEFSLQSMDSSTIVAIMILVVVSHSLAASLGYYLGGIIRRPGPDLDRAPPQDDSHQFLDLFDDEPPELEERKEPRPMPTLTAMICVSAISSRTCFHTNLGCGIVARQGVFCTLRKCKECERRDKKSQ